MPHSTWHNSNVDVKNSRRCISPCISSIYARSLLSTKVNQLKKSFRNKRLRFNRIVTDDPVWVESLIKFLYCLQGYTPQKCVGLLHGYRCRYFMEFMAEGFV